MRVANSQGHGDGRGARSAEAIDPLSSNGCDKGGKRIYRQAMRVKHVNDAGTTVPPRGSRIRPQGLTNGQPTAAARPFPRETWSRPCHQG